MSSEQVVKDFITTYNAHDFAHLRSLLADDFVFRPEGDVRVPAPAYIATCTALTQGFPDSTLTANNYQIEGEQVIVSVADVCRQQKWDKEEERERDTFPELTV